MGAAVTEFSTEFFASMFDSDPDPWGFRTRWYEARKRALTLACLPRAAYQLGYEPGCANGELAAALSTRCRRLIVSDSAAPAVAAATARLAGHVNVVVVQLLTPTQWPEGDFDLIVVSELAYYLNPGAFALLTSLMHDALNRGATIVAAHWRHPINGCAATGDDIHRAWSQRFDVPCVAAYTDRDVNIDVWCADVQSVAAREWLV